MDRLFVPLYFIIIGGRFQWNSSSAMTHLLNKHLIFENLMSTRNCKRKQTAQMAPTKQHLALITRLYHLVTKEVVEVFLFITVKYRHPEICFLYGENVHVSISFQYNCLAVNRLVSNANNIPDIIQIKVKRANRIMALLPPATPHNWEIYCGKKNQ